MNNKRLLCGLGVNKNMSLSFCLAVPSNDTSSKELTSYRMKYEVVKSLFCVISNRVLSHFPLGEDVLVVLVCVFEVLCRSG